MNINNYCYFHLNVILEHLDLFFFFLSRLSLLVRALFSTFYFLFILDDGSGTPCKPFGFRSLLALFLIVLNK